MNLIKHYFLTCKGIAQIIHIILLLICYLLVISVNRHYESHSQQCLANSKNYLDTSEGIYLRIFIFFLVYSFFFNMVDMAYEAFDLKKYFDPSVNIKFMEIIIFSCLTIGFFIISPMMVGSLSYYHPIFNDQSMNSSYNNVKNNTTNFIVKKAFITLNGKKAFKKLLIASILSYGCMITVASIGVFTWLKKDRKPLTFNMYKTNDSNALFVQAIDIVNGNQNGHSLKSNLSLELNLNHESKSPPFKYHRLTT